MFFAMANVLERFSERQAILLALGIFLAVATADYMTTFDKPLTLFYLLPIYILAWSSSRRMAIAVAVATIVAQVFADVASEQRPFQVFHAIVEWPLSLVFFALTTQVVHSLKASLRRERRLSSTDYLTGLKNSMAFYSALQNEIARAQRHRHPCTLVLVDVDDFKRINDSLGHARGDAVLRTIAAAIQGKVRRTDIVARVGGDEFALLLPETAEPGACRALEKIRQAVPRAVDMVPWPVTISVGAVTFSNFNESVDQMLHRADELMYAAKRSGKNQVSFRVACHAPA